VGIGTLRHIFNRLEENAMVDTQVVTLTITADTTVEAIGQAKAPPPPKEWQVVASARDGCSITPEGLMSIVDGTVISFTIGSLEGFEIKSILVNGEEYLQPSA
jgi:hypothetical protein